MKSAKKKPLTKKERKGEEEETQRKASKITQSSALFANLCIMFFLFFACSELALVYVLKK